MLVFRQILIFAIFLLSINIVLANDVSRLVFITDSQTIKLNEISGKLTIQSQDASENSVKVPQTVCLELKTSSNTGEFSSSDTKWVSVNVLTMSKGSANRNFYYKDSTIGTHALTIKAAFRPDEENRSCAKWPMEEWSIRWIANQNIIVLSDMEIAVPVISPTEPPEAKNISQEIGALESNQTVRVQQESLPIIPRTNFEPIYSPTAPEYPPVASEIVVKEIESIKQPEVITEIESSLDAGKKQNKIEKENLPATSNYDASTSASSQVAGVADIEQGGRWISKKWLILAIFSGIFGAAGFLFVQRQSFF